MPRDLILGQLPKDLACAIALHIIEDNRVVANLEALTLHDERMRPLGTVRDWLAGDDPLDVTTRDYLKAKREASMTTMPRPGQSAWAAASATRTRDAANQRARQARDLGRMLLAERGVLAHARQKGLPLIGVD
jgi:hypothetical protein